MATDTDRVYIEVVSKILDRKMDSLRNWDRKAVRYWAENEWTGEAPRGILPPDLLPRRGERNKRYWTREQVQRLPDWMIANKMYPGGSLPYYNPSPQEIKEVLQRQRRAQQKESGEENG
jgi:hypothetical protein